MNNNFLIVSALLFGCVSAKAAERPKLPPEVLERVERVAEQQRKKLEEQRRQDEVAGEEQWRAKWIPDKLEDHPSGYYFEAWLRARTAGNGNKEDKLRRINGAIGVLENLRDKAPDWKPGLVDKKLVELRATLKGINN
jgi:hypothetical protein